MVGRMVQRVMYGALAIAVLVALFLLDAVIALECGRWDNPVGDLLRCGSAIPLAFLAVVLAGALEMDRLLRATGTLPHTRFALAMVAIAFVVPWLSAAGWLGADVASVEGLYWPLVAIAVTVLGAGICQVFRGTPDGSFRDIGGTLAVVLYLGFLGSFALQIRCGHDAPDQEGVWLLLIALIVTKASDIGAYFIGSTFGRRKLSPLISPGKSVEGMFGGALASAAVALAFVAVFPAASALGLPELLVNRIGEMTFSFRGGNGDADWMAWLRAVFFGLSMSAAGQFGDLVESCFKRAAGIKDSGRIMPEYGGILDLVDSPLFAIPLAWFLLSAVWNIG